MKHFTCFVVNMCNPNNKSVGLIYYYFKFSDESINKDLIGNSRSFSHIHTDSEELS